MTEEGIRDHTKREAVCLGLVSDLPAPHMPTLLEEAHNLKSSMPEPQAWQGLLLVCVSGHRQFFDCDCS